MKTWGDFKRELSESVPDDTPLALVHLSVESQGLTGAQMQALIDAALRLGDAGFRMMVEIDAAEEEKLRHANRWAH